MTQAITLFKVLTWYIGGLVQDCSNSIASAKGLLQSCTKPSIYDIFYISRPQWHSSLSIKVFMEVQMIIQKFIYFFLQTAFSNSFSWYKVLYFNPNFIEIHSQESNQL